jgi:hypothetical protein
VLAILALVGDLLYLRPTVAAVLVHIDLDGDKPHPSSLVALAAGRQVASSWGATLYAALILHDDPRTAAEPGDRDRASTIARRHDTTDGHEAELVKLRPAIVRVVAQLVE